MDFRRALAGPSALGRSVRRYARAILVSIYLSARRIAGRYHQGRRASAFPLDDRSHRRNIKMVQRNRITREALRKVFDQIPKELSSETRSLELAGAVLRGFLGKKWFERNVMPNRRKSSFLGIDESSATKLDMSYVCLSHNGSCRTTLQFAER